MNDGWISVFEAVPPAAKGYSVVSDVVEVLLEDGTQDKGFYCNKNKNWYRTGRYSERFKNVTHWRAITKGERK